MQTERTWEISDIDGRNRRTVTLAEYRAEVEAAKAAALRQHARNVATVRRESGAA